jgi:cell wall-associated NlpC family hydrolase
MFIRPTSFAGFLRTALIALALILQSVPLARAAELPEQAVRQPESASQPSQYGETMHRLIDSALDLVGIRYRRGGDNAESGFDCSGFVGYVFLEQFGLKLPRTSGEISRTGEQVLRADLKPGDLVFFNTMRRAFSHVGIYMGDNQFVHAPRPGKAVRVEDIRESYWARRYNGARRITSE